MVVGREKTGSAGMETQRRRRVAEVAEIRSDELVAAAEMAVEEARRFVFAP